MPCDSQRGTILVVDDNPDLRQFLRTFLEKAGYRVMAGSDGAEGLRLYTEHQASIVLLITDVMMPNVNGFELADRVLEIDSKLPVLIMSGDYRKPHRGLECLAKPFRPNELIETVDRVLYTNPPSQQTASATN